MRTPRVEHFGRLLFRVKSNTRRGLRHLTDLEGNLFDENPQCTRYACICNCEAWFYNVTRPVCRHVIECIHYVLEPFNFNDEQFESVKDAIVFGFIMGKPLIESLGNHLATKHFDLIEPRTKPRRQYTLDPTKYYAQTASTN